MNEAALHEPAIAGHLRPAIGLADLQSNNEARASTPADDLRAEFIPVHALSHSQVAEKNSIRRNSPTMEFLVEIVPGTLAATGLLTIIGGAILFLDWSEVVAATTIGAGLLQLGIGVLAKLLFDATASLQRIERLLTERAVDR